MEISGNLSKGLESVAPFQMRGESKLAKYIATYKLTAEIWIREDLLERIGPSDEAQRDAVKILLESRFAGFRFAGFKIQEVKIE
jgi:hypothetical protein